MYRLIACDMDETLLDHSNRISPENLAAIQRARQAGVKFVPASGRGFASLQGILADLGLKDTAGEYTISFNGGALTENAGNRILHLLPLEFEKAEALFRFGLERGLCMHVYTPDTVYAFNLHELEAKLTVGRLVLEERSDRDLSFLKGQKIMKALYMDPDIAKLHALEKELATVTEGVDITYSSNRYMEFNASGVNKGEGLKALCRELGIPLSECIAIGDNWNDFSMLKIAGIGAAVANTVEDLLPYCNYHCKADCNHSAVAEVIDRFIS